MERHKASLADSEPVQLGEVVVSQNAAPSVKENFNTSSSEFQYTLGDKLGLERAPSILGGGFKGGGWSEESHRELFQKQMAEIGADATLTAIIDAGGANTKQGQLLTQIRDNPDYAEFKQALHGAMVKPDGLKAMQSIMAGGEGKFNTDDMEAMLKDPSKRGVFTQVLNKIATGEKGKDGQVITFAHAQTLLSQAKENDQAGMLKSLDNMGVTPPGMGLNDFFAFFRELMHDPTRAMNNLVNKLVETGQVDAQYANQLKGFLGPMGETMKFMVQPYHDLAVKYDLGSRTPGRIMNSLEKEGAAMTKKYDRFEKAEPVTNPKGLSGTRPNKDKFESAASPADPNKKDVIPATPAPSAITPPKTAAPATASP